MEITMKFISKEEVEARCFYWLKLESQPSYTIQPLTGPAKICYCAKKVPGWVHIRIRFKTGEWSPVVHWYVGARSFQAPLVRRLPPRVEKRFLAELAAQILRDDEPENPK